MKAKYLLMLLLAAIVCSAANANETEPNNTKSQANKLPLNGSTGGNISPTTDLDWFKVTTTSDGQLNLTLSSTNGKNVRAVLYDNDGITQLNSTVTAATAFFNTNGLAAGTYFIEVTTYYDGETPSYALSNTLTAAPVANDAEPDSSRATALRLDLNSTKTGHVGYYFNGRKDMLDFYKITTDGDGYLRLKLSSNNGSNVQAILYDNDAITQLFSVSTAATGYINIDGLAAGTYYVQVNSYYGSEFEPYTITDSLFYPVQDNDAEPDSSKATALKLPVNGTKEGHIGYYYNGHRDWVDFYKITTNTDGWLRLKLTSNNGSNVQAILYDNDGTTQLNAVISPGISYANTYDLAAGTYYVRVNSYYGGEFEPYTITDSLFEVVQTNDQEPDSTKQTALTLALNSNTEGHIGYYYNNHRDTTDFYKITTNKDGMLRLFITSYSGYYVQATLYDNNGTTYINAVTTPGVGHVDVDGLAAGTYYVKVNTYYSGQYAGYALGDSLFTYSFANDEEPNDERYQAKTIPANGTVTGHEDFYYNGQRNPLDWWRIYYTGSGSLDLTYKLQPHLLDGSISNVSFQVYKDTTAGPILSTVTAAASTTVNLPSLTQGYYYIKVSTYFGNEYGSYSITPAFNQLAKATIKILSYDKEATCTGNQIVFTCSDAQPPYTVQLYRFNLFYGDAIITNKKATFNNLPGGSYYATVYGDGASGSAYGKTKALVLEPVVTGLNTSNITADKARLKWTAVSCAAYYSVHYKVRSAAKWSTKKTDGNVNAYSLTGLQANTLYDWSVAAVDSANSITATGTYADSTSFTTAASLTAGTMALEENTRMNKNMPGSVNISPNPAVSSFIIHYNNGNMHESVNAVLYNVNGKAVWTSGFINGAALNGKQVLTGELMSGVYYLKITKESGAEAGSTRVVISR